MTLRDALGEILLPWYRDRLLEQLEVEYVVAIALCRIQQRGGPGNDADRAVIAWCDRRREGELLTSQIEDD